MRHIIVIFIFLLCSCTGLRKIDDRSKVQPINEQTISSLNGSYGIFTRDDATTTLDDALTLKKYWWKDWTGKDKYMIDIKAQDAHHVDVEVYKEGIPLHKETLKGNVKDGYFTIKSRKILFFYFLLNGYGQLTTRLGCDSSGNLVVDSHHLKFATLVLIPLTGDRLSEYGLVFPRKTASR